MGADVIIGVNAGTPLKEKDDLQSLVAILDQTMIITDYKRQKQNEELCELVIRPDLGSFSTSDFGTREVRGIIERGIASARQHREELEDIKRRYSDASFKPLADSTTGSELTGRMKGKPASKANVLRDRLQNPIVFGVSIRGNERLPYLFIYRLLGIRPSERLDLSVLTGRINYMYGLGYFEKIDYELQPVNNEAVRLILTIREKPLRRLRIGFDRPLMDS
jgi:NTE family protein